MPRYCRHSNDVTQEEQPKTLRLQCHLAPGLVRLYHGEVRTILKPQPCSTKEEVHCHSSTKGAVHCPEALDINQPLRVRPSDPQLILSCNVEACSCLCIALIVYELVRSD